MKFLEIFLSFFIPIVVLGGLLGVAALSYRYWPQKSQKLPVAAGAFIVLLLLVIFISSIEERRDHDRVAQCITAQEARGEEVDLSKCTPT